MVADGDDGTHEQDGSHQALPGALLAGRTGKHCGTRPLAPAHSRAMTDALRMAMLRIFFALRWALLTSVEAGPDSSRPAPRIFVMLLPMLRVALLAALAACAPVRHLHGGRASVAVRHARGAALRRTPVDGFLALRGGTQQASGIAEQVAEQGRVVRALKQAREEEPGAHSDAELAAAISKLKALKLLLHPPKPAGPARCAESRSGGHNKKGDTLEAIIASKNESFAAWYAELVVKSELIEYYDISGCYILRPWAFSIWEHVKHELDARIKAMGVQGCYFPMFVSEKALTVEQSHVDGFTPEVAWVSKAGKRTMAQGIAIRPTSETVIYPSFKKWIRSHRDLPLKVNQWCNVVRWEFKNPTPFLRTREFLWQEGHTAHVSKEEADAEVLQVLDMYADIYADLLAVPVIKGRKTESEKFAGAVYTTTVEAFIPGSGRAIQAATSHHLGQNFAKIFGIRFEDGGGCKQTVWQNSWGLTTRCIGIMIMIHSDDRGLVLPPRVAPVQVVLVPVVMKDCGMDELRVKLKEVDGALRACGLRTLLDDAEHQTPGWKYHHWEKKGVPVRVEMGPRDMNKESVRVVRRDTGDKIDVPLREAAGEIAQLLHRIQADMLERATAERDACIAVAKDWQTFAAALARKQLVHAPSCGGVACEDDVGLRSKSVPGAGSLDLPAECKQGAVNGEREGGEDQEDGLCEVEERSASAKALCVPLEQETLAADARCFACRQPATCSILWGRSY